MNKAPIYIYISNPESTKKAAERIRASESSIYRWIKLGLLPYKKEFWNKTKTWRKNRYGYRYVIDSDDLNKFIKEKCKQEFGKRIRCNNRKSEEKPENEIKSGITKIKKLLKTTKNEKEKKELREAIKTGENIIAALEQAKKITLLLPAAAPKAKILQETATKIISMVVPEAKTCPDNLQKIEQRLMDQILPLIPMEQPEGIDEVYSELRNKGVYVSPRHFQELLLELSRKKKIKLLKWGGDASEIIRPELVIFNEDKKYYSSVMRNEGAAAKMVAPEAKTCPDNLQKIEQRLMDQILPLIPMEQPEGIDEVYRELRTKGVYVSPRHFQELLLELTKKKKIDLAKWPGDASEIRKPEYVIFTENQTYYSSVMRNKEAKISKMGEEAIYQKVKAEYQKYTNERPYAGDMVPIPELFDRLKSQGVLDSQKEFHDLLIAWKNSGRISLETAGNQNLEPRYHEGIPSRNGQYFYIKKMRE